VSRPSPGHRRSAVNGNGPALLLIDVQRGLDAPGWGERNNPDAERRMLALLTAWRTAGLPVIHVQHDSVEPESPLRPDRPGNALKPGFEPAAGEPLFRKTANSAFIGTGLEAHLRAAGLRSLVVAGLTTDHCVSTTVRMAGNLGFDVILVGDATATFGRTGPGGESWTADQMHGSALASLHGEFARVVDADELLADLPTP
jgi:nicotinamidase-related amidase